MERWALAAPTGIEPDASKSALLRPTFRVGTNSITELAMDEGDRRLAEQATEDEAAEERAVITSRRARGAEE